MLSLSKALYLFYAAFTGLFIFLNLGGKITFGYGLGDLYMLFFFMIVFVIISVIRTKLRLRNNILNVVLITLIGLSVLFFVLKITLFRGNEYPWNGRLFLY